MFNGMNVMCFALSWKIHFEWKSKISTMVEYGKQTKTSTETIIAINAHWYVGWFA